MKKSITLVLSLLTLISLASCQKQENNKTSNEPSQSIENTTIIPSEETTNSPTSDDDIVVSSHAIVHLTDTIDLSGKLSDEGPKQKFIDYFNFHTMPNFLEDIEANHASEIKLYMNDKGVEEYLLSLGSRKTNGYITFNFSKEIKAINIFARPCYKYYNETWNNDIDVSLQVAVNDNIIKTVPLKEEKENKKPELTEVKVEFETPTKSFTISNLGDTSDNIGNRLFLEILELDF